MGSIRKLHTVPVCSSQALYRIRCISRAIISNWTNIASGAVRWAGHFGASYAVEARCTNIIWLRKPLPVTDFATFTLDTVTDGFAPWKWIVRSSWTRVVCCSYRTDRAVMTRRTHPSENLCTIDIAIACIPLFRKRCFQETDLQANNL